jgi:leucine dehydrogenase
VAGSLGARVVCGAANNQLVDDVVADELHRRGVLYVPDFVANCGGIIQVGGEYLGWSADRIEECVEAAIGRCSHLLVRARASDEPPLRQVAGPARLQPGVRGGVTAPVRADAGALA